MSWIKRLFGGGSGGAGSGPAAEPVEHAGFLIFVEPVKEAGGYRVAARIEKEVGGETKVHMMIRADVISNADEAAQTTLFKARQLIDQQGESIFR